MQETTTNMLPLFVYGTLKQGESNYTAYLEGRTTREQSATLRGAALYTEGKYPFLVVGTELTRPADRVCGMLMSIHSALYYEVMRQIDGLEEYTPGALDNWYERTIQRVRTADGDVEAWAYVAGARVLAAIRAGEFARITGGIWSKA
jgi:gamma-glutamylcyclotransferase (GGCT)/AIG2-like uncharacterized protein YtfP